MSINPFNPENIVKNVRFHLDDDTDKDFIKYLDKLKERLFYAARELKDDIFWGRTSRTKGLKELYNLYLTSEHKKFKELNKIWNEVLSRYDKQGFIY